MAHIRTLSQITKTPNDPQVISRNYSTYQDEFNRGNHIGNLINHYGNSINFKNEMASYNKSQLTTPLIYAKQTNKSFTSPSYQNLNAEAYMNNKIPSNYSSNYRTSEDSILWRPLKSAPFRTSLNHYWQSPTKSISTIDRSSLLDENIQNGRVNDYFVSKKWLKTETMNLRDVLVSFISSNCRKFYS
jgi:hypothetical protein